MQLPVTTVAEADKLRSFTCFAQTTTRCDNRCRGSSKTTNNSGVEVSCKPILIFHHEEVLKLAWSNQRLPNNIVSKHGGHPPHLSKLSSGSSSLFLTTLLLEAK
ncbi:hypothetical protein V6N13_100410 [Hibiscus sabdariffa]